MAFRLAESLVGLRSQVDAMASNRNKDSDGWIGDPNHAGRTSDHNPWIKEGDMGIVTALDITHDPKQGVDTKAMAEHLRLSRDPRIKYVISNGRIFSSTEKPWVWRSYTGLNPHTQHVHISVRSDKSHYDSGAPWPIKLPLISDDVPARVRPLLRRGSRGEDVKYLQTLLGIEADGRFGPQTEAAVKSFQTSTTSGGESNKGLVADGQVGPYTWAVLLGIPPKPRNINITATVFNDRMGAYGPIDHTKPVVSLPAPFPGERPLVRVFGPTGVAVGRVEDKGPWYDGTVARPADPYWLTGARPRAETDPRANGAGIDLNPTMAALVGVTGKDEVDWEFVK